MKESAFLLKKTEETEERYLLLEKMIAAPEIIADNRYWRKILLEKEELDEIISLRRRLIRIEAEYDACKVDSENEEMKKLLQEEMIALSQEESSVCKRLNDLLAQRSGNNEVILEFLPNGNKALAFCEALISSTEKYAGSLGLKTEKKGNTLLVKGSGASAHMREESGLHKAVSDETVTVTVTLLSTDQKEVQLDEKDLKIDLFHSGGAGGQNINKVETAIRVTHLPTGIVVTCQDERSQLQNKRKALERLKNRLLERQKTEQEKERAALRKKAGEKVVCTYNMTTNIVTKSDGSKYRLDEYMEGRRI